MIGQNIHLYYSDSVREFTNGRGEDFKLKRYFYTVKRIDNIPPFINSVLFFY